MCKVRPRESRDSSRVAEGGMGGSQIHEERVEFLRKALCQARAFPWG